MNRKQSRKDTRRKFFLEHLESRQLMAADILLSGSTLLARRRSLTAPARASARVRSNSAVSAACSSSRPRCDASANPDFGSSCMRVTRLPDNVGLTYKFKRTHLAQWREIEAGVMGLIASFRPK